MQTGPFRAGREGLPVKILAAIWYVIKLLAVLIRVAVAWPILLLALIVAVILVLAGK